MNFIISFFRDILDGPVYIITTVISSILFCACLGYLLEKSQNQKKEKEKYAEVTPTSSETSSPAGPSLQMETTVSPAVENTPISSPAPTTIPAQSTAVMPTAPMIQSEAEVQQTPPEITMPPADIAIPISEDQAANPIPEVTTSESSPVIPEIQTTPTLQNPQPAANSTTPAVTTTNPPVDNANGVPTSINNP